MGAASDLRSAPLTSALTNRPESALGVQELAHELECEQRNLKVHPNDARV
jgi:hypothetical protein